MVAGHSLEPWTLYKNVGDTRTFQISDKNGNVVCILCRYRRAEANATLMTAAPEMLEALKYIVAWNGDNWSSEIARDMANEAIAKAERNA